MAIVLSGSQRTTISLATSASMELPFGDGDDRLLTVGVFQRNNNIYTASLVVGGSLLTLAGTTDNTVPANKLRSQIFFIPGHPMSSCVLTACFGGATIAEIMSIASGEYMESEIVETGAFSVELLQNVYNTGDTSTIKYRHASTEASCVSASWLNYTTPFLSDGYVQIRVEK